jgi:succinate dehydrogenase / fumarate reductase cytochrome b subunit
VESSAAAPAAASPSSSSFFGRHQFLILRLHSLSGLIPVGAYMCIHLLTNASVLAGPETFQKAVDQIHTLGPALPLVEWAFIFLPIIFHAVVGVIIIRSGIYNTVNYPFRSNIRYTLQRATAWIALFFIFYHVFHMHGWIHAGWWKEVIHGAGGLFDAERATSSAALALASVFVKIVYAIGVLSCVYHLANGLWTMGITWGLWTTPQAQRRADYVCGAFGIVMAVVGMGALAGISRVDPKYALATEKVTLETRLSELERIQKLSGSGDASLERRIEEVKSALEAINHQQKELEQAPPATRQASLEK